MKITAIHVYQVDLPLKEGRYSWSNGNFVDLFDSTIVGLETDSGLHGYGECCPLGSAYLPSFALGVRAGLAELAPHLIGRNPLNLAAINHAMDTALRGHPYAKSPLDIACWDLLGQAAGQPVYALLGGQAQEDIALYRAISQDTPEAMTRSIEAYAAEGYGKFQLKVGGAAQEDIARIQAARAALPPAALLVADANTGWTRHEAMRVANAIAGLDVYVEQPCPSYEESLSVRRRTALPFILDEVIDTPAMLTRAIAEDAMDVVNLKISKAGGLSKARLMRDICVAHGIAMTIEDTWGGDIATAAIAHLALSTPAEFAFSATDFNSYGSLDTARGAPRRANGRMTAPPDPGLGISPLFDALGEPVATYR